MSNNFDEFDELEPEVKKTSEISTAEDIGIDKLLEQSLFSRSAINGDLDELQASKGKIERTNLYCADEVLARFLENKAPLFYSVEETERGYEIGQNGKLIGVVREQDGKIVIDLKEKNDMLSAHVLVDIAVKKGWESIDFDVMDNGPFSGLEVFYQSGYEYAMANGLNVIGHSREQIDLIEEIKKKAERTEETISAMKENSLELLKKWRSMEPVKDNDQLGIDLRMDEKGGTFALSFNDIGISSIDSIYEEPKGLFLDGDITNPKGSQIYLFEKIDDLINFKRTVNPEDNSILIAGNFETLEAKTLLAKLSQVGVKSINSAIIDMGKHERVAGYQKNEVAPARTSRVASEPERSR